MKRAVWRARSAGSAAATSFRSQRRDDRGAEPGCSRARGGSGAADHGRPATVAEELALERPLLRALPAERRLTAERPRRGWTQRRWSRSGRTGTRCRSRSPGCGCSRDRRAEIGVCTRRREVALHERLHGSTAPARSLDHYLELLARKPGALRRVAGAGPGARPWRLAGCFDELWAKLDRALGRLGGRPADGRRADALPRARPRATSSWRSAARSRPARSTGAPSRVLARRADRPPPAALDGLEARLGRARPARADARRAMTS